MSPVVPLDSESSASASPKESECFKRDAPTVNSLAAVAIRVLGSPSFSLTFVENEAVTWGLKKWRRKNKEWEVSENRHKLAQRYLEIGQKAAKTRPKQRKPAVLHTLIWNLLFLPQNYVSPPLPNSHISSVNQKKKNPPHLLPDFAPPHPSSSPALKIIPLFWPPPPAVTSCRSAADLPRLDPQVLG